MKFSVVVVGTQNQILTETESSTGGGKGVLLGLLGAAAACKQAIGLISHKVRVLQIRMHMACTVCVARADAHYIHNGEHWLPQKTKLITPLAIKT